MLVWEEDVEKVHKYSHCGLQDISFWIDKNPFFCPAENPIALHKITFIWKNVQNSGAFLGSFFKASWLYAWKNSNHFELYNILEKNGK